MLPDINSNNYVVQSGIKKGYLMVWYQTDGAVLERSRRNDHKYMKLKYKAVCLDILTVTWHPISGSSLNAIHKKTISSLYISRIHSSLPASYFTSLWISKADAIIRIVMTWESVLLLNEISLDKWNIQELCLAYTL